VNRDLLAEAFDQFFRAAATTAERVVSAAKQLGVELERWGERHGWLPGGVRDVIQDLQDVAERKTAYQERRAREALTALHFGGEARPTLKRRPQRDPLRHQRQRAWRRCSRRDQSDVRTEQRSER
jgi:hypothetical protein